MSVSHRAAWGWAEALTGSVRANSLADKIGGLPEEFALISATRRLSLWFCHCAIAVAVTPCLAGESPPDIVFLHGKIATSDDAQPQAQALAVRHGKLTFVGSDKDGAALAGAGTRVVDLKGRRVIPGLVDAHVHPTTVVDSGICDIDDKPLSLAGITAFVRKCARLHPGKPGTWLSIDQWNSWSGNEADVLHSTFRQALDLAVSDRPVQLLGDDGHHGAFNSAALALARDHSGKIVGLSGRTLLKELAHLRKYVGVDAGGEPDGAVTDDAITAIGAPDAIELGAQALAAHPERMVRVFLEKGITAVLDAYVTPHVADVYRALIAQHKLDLRANLAVYLDPESSRKADGTIDYDGLIGSAVAMRESFAGNRLVSASNAKIFADGGLEGDPGTDPPTLPNSAVLQPFLQPIFRPDARGDPQLRGYVDLDGAACRSLPADGLSGLQVADFETQNGFHPAQCIRSNGKLQSDQGVILEYARRLHLAGFTLHFHAEGDRAVRVSVDAIEGARAADGNADLPDTIAHLQLVSSDDIERIGRNHLFLAMTYAWADTDPGYDPQVIPFIDRVRSLAVGDLHDPKNYYEGHAYAVRSMVRAGGIAVAGSDANVETRDPRPFFNMQVAVTRSRNGTPPLNPNESLTLAEVFRAYTIDGARALGRSDEIGSIAIGKSADFVILDRDFFSIPIDQVGNTRVLQTWFQGRKVYDLLARH
jgi:predicted amidohydrolase YtcJ